MAKNVVLILEYGNGGYSCYNDEPLGNYGVIDGDGATAEEAKADFMKALQECREDEDRKSTRLNSSHRGSSRMPSSA